MLKPGIAMGLKFTFDCHMHRVLRNIVVFHFDISYWSIAYEKSMPTNANAINARRDSRSSKKESNNAR